MNTIPRLPRRSEFPPFDYSQRHKVARLCPEPRKPVRFIVWMPAGIVIGGFIAWMFLHFRL